MMRNANVVAIIGCKQGTFGMNREGARKAVCVFAAIEALQYTGPNFSVVVTITGTTPSSPNLHSILNTGSGKVTGLANTMGRLQRIVQGRFFSKKGILSSWLIEAKVVLVASTVDTSRIISSTIPTFLIQTIQGW